MKGYVLFGAAMALACTSQAQTKTIAYQELPPAGSNMFFAAEMDQDTIRVTFAGADDRWIALGLGNGMAPTDVLVYSEGKSGATHAQSWRDYFNSSQLITGVNEDASQDWIIDSSIVSNGLRTVYAHRPLSTGDNSDVDVVFANGNLDLVWARGSGTSFVLANHGAGNRRPGISLAWQNSAGFEEAVVGKDWSQKGKRIVLHVPEGSEFQALLTDMQGRVLYQTRSSLEMRLDMFPSGVYVLQLHREGKATAAKVYLP